MGVALALLYFDDNYDDKQNTLVMVYTYSSQELNRSENKEYSVHVIK